MSIITCWVPNCNARQEDNFNCKFFPLPKDPKYRETWLALTAKPLFSEEGVYYCENHFRSNCFEKVLGKIVGLTHDALPYHNMPQMICRTCLGTIERNNYFCVLSGTIPCAVPSEYVTDLVQCRPEPLYHILTFCIPNLNLTQNPPSLICMKCYHNIWQYFIFKLQSNIMDNNLRGTLPPEVYGKAVLCRCCPDTTSRFFGLNETQPMGEVLSNIFLSKFPTDVVPLKVCLKCWNVLQKLSVFHQKCITMNELFQRCFDLNAAQTRYSPFPLSSDQKQPTVPPPADQKQLAVPPPAERKQSTVISNQKQSITVLPPTAQTQSTVEAASPIRFSVQMWEPAASTSKCVNSAVSESVASCSSDLIRCGDVNSVEVIGEKCNERRNLAINRDVSQAAAPETQANNSDTQATISNSSEEKFTGESIKLLVHLILQHSKLITPNINPIEWAKLDLEMWINVMKGLHDNGYCFTLGYVQFVWRRLESSTKSACATIGPLTHLDFLVNIYLSRVGRTRRPISTQSEGEKKSGKFVEGEVICIDDDSDVEELSNAKKRTVETAKINEKQTNDRDNKHKGHCNVASTTKTVDIQHTRPQPSEVIPKPKRPVGRPSTKPSEVIPKPKGPVGRPSTKPSEVSPKPKRPVGRPSTKPSEVSPKPKGPVGRPSTDPSEVIPKPKGPVGRPGTKPSEVIPKPKRPVGRPSTKPSEVISKPKGPVGCPSTSLKMVKKKGKLARNHNRTDAWNSEQKLELVRAMRREYIQLVQSNELGCYKFTPWKRILESLISKGFTNCGFSKLYAVWSKMKMSATIYEKNGMDMVDNEVWELLKYHTNTHVEQLRIREGSNGSRAMEDEEEIDGSNHSESATLKKTKRPSSDSSTDSKCSSLNSEHTGRDIIDDTETNEAHTTGTEVLNLLKLYRHRKSSTQNNKRTKHSEEEAPSSAPPATSSNVMDQQKLDLVSVVRSFGNEVFNKEDNVEREDFWTRVANRFHAKGHNWSQDEVRTVWNTMLHSAKLTWAQDGRTPNVGDHAIIDFMTEVIKEKEKNKHDTNMNLSGESDRTEDTGGTVTGETENSTTEAAVLQNVKTPAVIKEEKYKNETDLNISVEGDKTEVTNGIVKCETGRIEEGSRESREGANEDEENYVGDYDYVSLDDLREMCGTNVVEPLKPVVLPEVIEISDSDEE